MAGLEIVLSAAIDMFRLIGKHDGRVEMPPTSALQAMNLRPAGRAVRERACLNARDSIIVLWVCSRAWALQRFGLRVCGLRCRASADENPKSAQIEHGPWSPHHPRSTNDHKSSNVG